MPRSSNLVLKLIVFGVIVLAVIALGVYKPAKTNQVQPNVAQTQTAAPTVTQLPTAQCKMHGTLPDPTCTPGAVNPNVTQDNIGQTICVSGFTKTIRPPTSYTNQLKLQQMQAYGFSDSTHQHEEDHLISLELGGAPADPANLWPEPGASPNPKDKVENFLHAAVCAGRISLLDAQHRIATDWTTAEQGLAQ